MMTFKSRLNDFTSRLNNYKGRWTTLVLYSRLNEL